MKDVDYMHVAEDSSGKIKEGAFLKEATGAFVVKFTRRPASEGINGGTDGGITEGKDRLVDYIRNTPGRNVTEISAMRTMM